jgi:hypothetical protein
VLEDQDGHQQDIANYVHSELKGGRSKRILQIKGLCGHGSVAIGGWGSS